MGITKSNLNGMDWDNELLYIQTSRIETLKSTIAILQDTIKAKDQRIEMLNEMLSNKTRSVSGSDKRSE